MKKLFYILFSAIFLILVSCNPDTYIQEDEKFEDSSQINIPNNISADITNYANKFFLVFDHELTENIDSTKLESIIDIDSYEYIDDIESNKNISSITLLEKEYAKDEKFNIEIGDISTYSDFAWKIEDNKLFINKAILVLNNLFGSKGKINDQEIIYSVYDLDKVNTIEVSDIRFKKDSEDDVIEKTGSIYNVSISDNTNPLIITPEYESNDSDIFCYIEKDSKHIGISKDPTIYAYKNQEDIIEWEDYTLSREYRIINKNNEYTNKFDISLEISPNLKPYMTEIAVKVLTSFNPKNLCDDLLLAAETIDGEGKGTTENGLIVEIIDYNSLVGKLAAAKLAQYLGQTGKYPQDITTSLSVGSEVGYTHGFTSEDITLKGNLDFSLTGRLHAKGDVRAEYSKYEVSASEVAFIIDGREYKASFSGLIGGIDFVADPKMGSTVVFTVNSDSLTAPERSDSVITINGIDINYSDIFDLIATETE